ncbi:MAG: uncharacterized protein RL235_179, partial [Chlamydiota bacterium]
RTALFGATFLSIILGVSLAIGDPARFLILNLVTSIVVIISARAIRLRKEVLAVCFKSWLSSILVLYAFVLSERDWWSPLFVTDVFTSLGFLMATAILVMGLLPLLESAFGVLTDMTLMEYLDPGSELLRRFALEVPGTYHHSQLLGALAESCATAIGANGLFCRAAALYHDIGKMVNPPFYTENKRDDDVNVHQLLTPTESAGVIIAHVTDGIAIARKHRLPESFIDIIAEHHGTTLVYYFYRKELDVHGGDPLQVDAEQFRYPGPTPRSKESAIMMLCDSVEAASRSLENKGLEGVQELVERLIADKIREGQMNACQLTFQELEQIKKALVKALVVAHHTRIKYPKKEIL